MDITNEANNVNTDDEYYTYWGAKTILQLMTHAVHANIIFHVVLQLEMAQIAPT